MAELIHFALSNFTLTFLALGLLVGLIVALRKGLTRATLAEELLAYFILFTIAFAYFYNFVFHVFFGYLAPVYIGWADSPFRIEPGFASPGFAAVGVLAFRGGLRQAHCRRGAPQATPDRSKRAPPTITGCRRIAGHLGWALTRTGSGPANNGQPLMRPVTPRDWRVLWSSSPEPSGLV